MPQILSTCPNCRREAVEPFYSVESVPVHSVMLVPTQEEALHFPSGKITLGHCRACGFITNSSFDESKMKYSPKCEETQGFSATFQAFHQRLTEDLIDRCDVRNKTVLEIGCGKGEFISMLCAMGGNRGVGFDPAFVPQRRPEKGGDAVKFIQDFYSDKYTSVTADFVACKMTLEHIPDTLRFVSMVRRAIGNNLHTTVFFQVPDMKRVIADVAFWDIYHEHCSYFNAGSLRNLFVMAGFDVIDVWSDYDDQYLMITARPAKESLSGAKALVAASIDEGRSISTFASEADRRIRCWKSMVDRQSQDGQRIVIWGSGSKGVAFLSALGEDVDQGGIKYAVDINPFRTGYFMPGTGQEIVDPAFLSTYRPDAVIAMNSIYTSEIQSELRRYGLIVPVLPIEAVEMLA